MFCVHICDLENIEIDVFHLLKLDFLELKHVKLCN